MSITADRKGRQGREQRPGPVLSAQGRRWAVAAKRGQATVMERMNENV
jgi:hypothetical protein